MSDDKHTEEKYNAWKYSSEQFDKHVLYIASGALGISFAFIEKIVPDINDAICKNHLIISWCILAGVIFFFLIGHFFSSQANRWAIVNEPDEEDKEDEPNEETKKYNLITKRLNQIIRTLNLILIIAIATSMYFLINFISVNI